MAKEPKLTKLLEGIFEEQPQINKYEVVEGVKSYGVVGKSLYNNSNIMEIAKQLSKIAENAHTHIVSETDDWFDKVSVNKNMQTLKRSVADFRKTAMESHQLNQRLTAIYEDMGHILNRYYDITEGDELVGETVNDPDGLAPDSPAQSGEDMKEALDSDKTAVGGGDEEPYAAKDGEAMKESSQSDPHNVDGNNPNGGEEPSKDGEEMQEVKRLKDVGGVVGIPALGQFVNKFRK
tara:strand:- start:144 stop:848 length:705 start_codon:yes stop_codon:yes gene_type:complete